MSSRNFNSQCLDLVQLEFVVFLVALARLAPTVLLVHPAPKVDVVNKVCLVLPELKVKLVERELPVTEDQRVPPVLPFGESPELWAILDHGAPLATERTDETVNEENLVREVASDHLDHKGQLVHPVFAIHLNVIQNSQLM